MTYRFPATRAERASVRRSSPAPSADYRSYRQDLRFDFWYSCAYCSITEAEARAISFEIDHYEPVAAHPALAHEYGNLNYACAICNGRKADTSPTAYLEQTGMRLFRPDVDDFSEHFAPNGARLDPRSPIGEYTDVLLHVNREGLRELRRLRAELGGSVAEIMEGLRALRDSSVDQLPPHVRARFLAVRRDLLDKAEEIPKEINELLRGLCRSAYADPDPEREAWTKRRREFLRQQNALGADPWRATHGGVSVAARTPRGGKRRKRGRKR